MIGSGLLLTAMKGLLWGIVCFCLTAGSYGQNLEIKVRLIGKEIFIEEKTGQLRQLTHDGSYKENVQLSPDGSKVAYHGSYDPYDASSSRRLVLTVVDTSSAKVLAEIPVRWQARYVSRVVWIGPQKVLIEGEGGFIAILDVAQGMQASMIYGSDFRVSPDQTKIAFRKGRIPRYGQIPPEFESDYLDLLLLDEKEGKPWTVYPELFAPGRFEPKPIADPSKRHVFCSAFVWSKDNRRVAFVEKQSGASWLVVLTVTPGKPIIQVPSQRFQLIENLGTVTAVEWQESRDSIRIAGTRGVLLVHLRNRLIEQLPSPPTPDFPH